MIKTSAPGSFVLFGEHSVLNGEPAVGCSVSQRLFVTLNNRDDLNVSIDSSLGYYHSPLNNLAPSFSHRYTLALLERWKHRLKHGLDITITSELSSVCGLGSSAALTVALMAALHQLEYNRTDRAEILKDCIAVMLDVQQRGSGLDLASSTYGGIIHYKAPAAMIRPLILQHPLPLTLFYCGYKTPTPTVLAQVAEASAEAPHLYKALYRLMGQCTTEAIDALEQDNCEKLGKCMNFYHGLLDTLGVCDKTLANMLYTLKEQSAVSGVKISGSGLGDCLVVLGKPDPEVFPAQKIAVDISDEGVKLETS
ncbi:MAG: mevalonate kinase [Endozoicomonadaceae bacterium]|nr:mevalonate kinase [Endozoicomonadaceae bacterium]